MAFKIKIFTTYSGVYDNGKLSNSAPDKVQTKYPLLRSIL